MSIALYSVCAKPDVAAAPPDTLASTSLQSSVTKNGITWTFDASYYVGQFINGDYFVVDPGSGVTVSSRTPAPSGNSNGSMVNQSSGTVQGYETGVGYYNVGSAVTFPVSLSGGDVITGVITDYTYPFTDVIGHYDALQHSYVSDGSVLHVVSTTPYADQFRPGYVGTNREVLRYSDIILANLPQETSAYKPATSVIDTATAWFQGPWLDSVSYWTSRYLHPKNQAPNYGREWADAVGHVACLLSLDYTEAQLQDLLIGFVQLGIDIYHNLGIGVSYSADGGHQGGKILPVLIAGKLLNHTGMLSISTAYGENQECYYSYGASKVSSSNPGQDAVAFWGNLGGEDDFYQCGCLAACSGNKINAPLSRNADGCAGDGYRNCCTSLVWVGQCIAMHLFGVKTNWNHDAFSDYVRRWMGDGLDTPVVGGGSVSANGFDWIVDLWGEKSAGFY